MDKRCLSVIVLLFGSGFWVPISTYGAQEESILRGYGRESSHQQRLLENRFDSLIRKENLRSWMKWMTTHPHHLGSPFGKKVAEFIADQFQAWGFETEIEEFQVLFPTPKVRKLVLLEPERVEARLEEPRLDEDQTSGQTDEQLPTYNAYSPDGDVTGELVYVNYGIPRDYEVLEERGIDVAGKIVLARYGGSWRGIKPKVAAEHGALGCIIYSDPQDDGYFQGDLYPRGSWRNEYGAQRGSVVDMPLYPGDPLTPGIGATDSAKRLSRSEARSLPKIPVLPISYADALPLLKNLQGPVAPLDWRGALPLTYHLGPGPAKVRLTLAFDWKLAPTFDVIARIKGADWPEEWIVRGNHHDAWVYGAGDPVSAMVALMEEARVVGELVRQGWKPRRTLIYAAWDGEEPGLLGSTEWAEEHADQLIRHAAVYINTDSTGRGFLNCSGSPTLERFINEIARDVTDPEKGISVWERLRAYQIMTAPTGDLKEIRQRSLFHLDPLGAGSDYTVFVHHLGVASLDLGFGGENDGGSYHSIYDSFDHYTRFGDPTFDYGVALTKVTGRAILRFANSEVLPFEFSGMADAVERFTNQVIRLADEKRAEVEEKNRRVLEKTLEAYFDPTLPFVLPKSQPVVPFLNFAPLQNALSRLKEGSSKLEQLLQRIPSDNDRLSGKGRSQANQLLAQAERALTAKEGLPRRPWFKHEVYAPGFYTGYQVKTLPGIREALEQQNWHEAEEQIRQAADTLDQFTYLLNDLNSMISSPKISSQSSPDSWSSAH